MPVDITHSFPKLSVPCVSRTTKTLRWTGKTRTDLDLTMSDETVNSRRGPALFPTLQKALTKDSSPSQQISALLFLPSRCFFLQNLCLMPNTI